MRIWDKNGVASDWAEPQTFDIAMLDSSEWQANWITAGDSEPVLQPVTIQFDQPVAAREVRLNITKAVSYTHLDVYKRQDSESCVHADGEWGGRKRGIC